MFIRVEDLESDEFCDVTPEMANKLVADHVLCHCPSGGHLHPADDKDWTDVMIAIKRMAN